jgi:hypothetical protein
LSGSLQGSCTSGSCTATVSGTADGKQLSQTLSGPQKGNQAILTNRAGSRLTVNLDKDGKTQVVLSLKSADGKSWDLNQDADSAR